MDITPSDIARRTFTLVRRGFDPQEVSPFLEAIAAQLANHQQQLTRAQEDLTAVTSRLDEARSTEEALRMTMVAATQVKEEMVRKATAESEEMVAAARAEANQVRRDANSEAEHAVTAARRDALELIEESRREARDLVVSAREENNDLVERLEVLRRSVREVEAALRAASEVAGERLAGAASRLSELDDVKKMPAQPADQWDRRAPEPAWPDPRGSGAPEGGDEPRRRPDRTLDPVRSEFTEAKEAISFEVEAGSPVATADRWSVTELRELNG